MIISNICHNEDKEVTKPFHTKIQIKNQKMNLWLTLIINKTRHNLVATKGGWTSTCFTCLLVLTTQSYGPFGGFAPSQTLA